MTTGTVALLMATMALLFFGVVQLGASLLVLWSLKTLRPEQNLRADFVTLQGMVDALESQVTKLRTRKAGATSARKREEAAVSTDPDLEGLSEEELALFR